MRLKKRKEMLIERVNQLWDTRVEGEVEIKIGNHWEVGIVKKLFYQNMNPKIMVQRRLTWENCVFDYGSCQMVRRGTFLGEEKKEDTVGSWASSVMRIWKFFSKEDYETLKTEGTVRILGVG